MKKLIFLVCMVFVASCSDDDGSSSADSEKELDVITTYTYTYSDMGTHIQKSDTKFEQDKPVKITRYTHSGEIASYTDYIYNEDGLLSEIQDYDVLQNVITQTTSISYDASGRMTEIERVYFVDNSSDPWTSIRTFSYDENTITSDGYTYYLNDNGLIFKEINPWGGVKQKIFDNNNILSLSFENSITEYNYYTEHLPKGNYLKQESNKYGYFKPNADLFNGFLGHVLPTDNYMHTVSNASINSNYMYNYEFDDDGYPIKSSYMHLNYNRPLFENEITYQD